MKKIEVNGSPLNVNGGFLKLTKAQASDRTSCLKIVEGHKDVYEVISPTQFKVGEKLSMSPTHPDEKDVEGTDDSGKE